MIFLFFFEGLRPSYPKKSKTSDVIAMIGVPNWGCVTGRFLIRYLLHSQWHPQPQAFSMSPAIGGWLNKNSQATLLGRTSSEVFVMLIVVILHSLLFFIHWCFCILELPLYASGTPPWLLRPVKASTSSEIYPGYFRLLCLSIYPERYGFEWAFFIHRRFLAYSPSPTFLTQPAFIKAYLEPGSSSLKFAGLHADPQNTDPLHLFVWFTAIHNLHIQKNSFLNCTKYHQELLVVKV